MARAAKGKKASKARKARKAAPAKARASKPAMAGIQAVVPDSGPVTLAEARALAQAKQPMLAAQAVDKAAAPPASPAAVGAEREKLRKEQRDERVRRVREYLRHDGNHETARRPAATADRPQGSRRRAHGRRRRIVRPAADFRRGGFLVRLSRAAFWRRHHNTSSTGSASRSSISRRRVTRHAICSASTSAKSWSSI